MEIIADEQSPFSNEDTIRRIANKFATSKKLPSANRDVLLQRCRYFALFINTIESGKLRLISEKRKKQKKRKQIPSQSQKEIAKNEITALFQFVMFIELVQGDVEEITIELLASTVKVSSFFFFFDCLDREANTIFNRAKSLSMFFSFLQQFRELEHTRHSILGVQFLLCNLKKTYRKLYYIHLANEGNADLQREKGLLLTDKQLLILFHYCLKTMSRILSETKGGFIPQEHALLFEKSLIVLYFLSLGGQRKEVVVNIYLDNFKKSRNGYYLLLSPEKVNRRDCTVISIPQWLGEITEYFKLHICDNLIRKRKNMPISMWINTRGDPLSDSSCTDYVSSFVRLLFPNGNITPISFRRLFVTLVNEHNSHLDGETMEYFLDRLARSINTSTAAMRKHYNRSLGTQNSILVQNHLAKSFLSTPQSDRQKTLLKKFIGMTQSDEDEEYNEEGKARLRKLRRMGSTSQAETIEDENDAFKNPQSVYYCTENIDEFDQDSTSGFFVDDEQSGDKDGTSDKDKSSDEDESSNEDEELNRSISSELFFEPFGETTTIEEIRPPKQRTIRLLNFRPFPVEELEVDSVSLLKENERLKKEVAYLKKELSKRQKK